MQKKLLTRIIPVTTKHELLTKWEKNPLVKKSSKLY